MKPYVFFFAFFLLASGVHAQNFSIRTITSFGAKGDGKTNDQAAFELAAQFFNNRKGQGKLVIPKGVYIVGKQEFTRGKNGKPAFEGHDVLHLTNVKNFAIEGAKGATLKYTPGLKFGSFEPETGLPYVAKGYFVNWAYAAMIGHCIFIDQSENVTVSGLELDGNSKTFVLGGSYGDVGRQLPHYGVFIQNSRSVNIKTVWAHHFALDGICVANKAAEKDDDIEINDSRFEYNSRQGLSWIGGNDLKVKNCAFNHTGQGAFNSAPGAGVDIEAEYGPVKNGKFKNCEFTNNKGCALVADSGNSSDCEFESCTFWGVENWSVWVNKPGFTFRKCNLYGSIVHGYNASTEKEATKFIDCWFEDKAYQAKEPFGNFLIESNGMRRVSFINCTMVANKKKLFWLSISPILKPEEKYQFDGCRIISKASFAPHDYSAIFRGVRYRNTTFEFQNPKAKLNGNGLNDCCEAFNVDAGGNKTIWK
ncbi:right-handed parallel beta-helix repeat-containing protein [Flavisolibacter nicotianae]|uniref:right-handed parallel beta-helix repeat-containing protein n=1 Tax=Flavisolibacter nicotianae TaxID=2364882 RepID=UPI0013C4A243|nr:right-handed parallel beta-helix repeat-containing protein [Flavisolibacter nicotianae]